jgi:hypothetical protein
MTATGPAEGGSDLERLLEELRHKGWPAHKVQAARECWEDVCHDPMRRGRGGKGLPQNEPPHPEPPPLSPIKPDLDELLDRTTGWPADLPIPPAN